MTINQDNIKLQIQKLLGEEITLFELKGKGACNNAYYIETKNGGRYIVKRERDVKEFQPQNDLVVEAGVVQELHNANLSVHTPNVLFISENPEMYGYEYVEGDMMIDVWESLSEDERMSICSTLGNFHAEIGNKITKQMAQTMGITIDMSPEVHPEVTEEYNTLMQSADVPEEFKMLAKEARLTLDGTMDDVVFQCIHNDAHHENIIVKDKQVSGIIDFGNAEYGEIAKEFSRYIRDYPDYFQHIVSAYEQASGNKLSYTRLVTNALLCGFIDIVEDYQKGGASRTKAEGVIATYRKLMNIKE